MAQEQILEHDVLPRAQRGQDGRQQEPEEFEHTLSIADQQPIEVRRLGGRGFAL
jgi:hypothetical protein